MWTSSLTISRARHHGPMNAPVDIPKNLFVCIDHVGIAVPDLDEAIAFYRDAFGMEVAHEEVNEEQGVREAMVQINSEGGDTTTQRIQLLAPLNDQRSEEHTSELQSLMRISSDVFCLQTTKY